MEQLEGDIDLIFLAEEPTEGNRDGFANSLAVWINKPHVVNRRLCGSKLRLLQVSSRSEHQRLCKHKLLRSVFKEHREGSSSSASEPPEAGQIHEESVVQEVEGLSEYTEDDELVIIREMLPKQPDRHKNIPELIIFDKAESCCTFYPVDVSRLSEDTTKDTPMAKRHKTSRGLEVTYRFTYRTDPNRIELHVSSSDFSPDSERTMSLTWLKGQLVKKLSRWSGKSELKTSPSSLKLLPLEEYGFLYNSLKEKYGLHFAKIWPEKTDPQKFVFEDVAIATYLLLLWKHDAELKKLTRKQSFVDLGCGNGLLVHILSSEGHPGYGIDVRRRNIWDLYGPGTVLKEQSLTPSSDTLFPETDWLIGNHSDELTPWIPVMAARSSYTCCYFVLPCCHYDFDCRFKVKGVGTGQYRTYLDYVQFVGTMCGFGVEEDMLRIPSTKRVCFVGRFRSYPETLEKEMDKHRTEFIRSRCSQNSSGQMDTITDPCPATGGQSESDGSARWATDFKPRDKVETSRNCVTVRTEVKEHFVKTVFAALMAADNSEVCTLPSGQQWRKGGKIPLSEVVALCDRSLLQELKSECGGLQTLLRNHSNIFQVSNGKVQLRDFTLEDPWGVRRKGKTRDVGDRMKTALCWFNENHPDGCPLPATKCSFAHSVEELRIVNKK